MADAGGKLGFLLFYVAFYLIIAFVAANATGDLGGFGVSKNIVSPPQLAWTHSNAYSGSLFGNLGDLAVNIFSTIVYIMEYIAYFFGLQGLTLFGVSSDIALLISLPLTIGFVYVVISLIRGGS